MVSRPPGLVRLDRPRARAAAETLARAFSDYTLLRTYFPDKSRREQVARYFFLVPVYLGLSQGEAYATSERFEGVAVWLPSGRYPVSSWGLMRAVPLPVLFSFGRHGGAKLGRVGRHLDATHRRLAPFPHWYLQVLGVAPEHQGQGHASRLLRPVLARLDAEHARCYLETLNEPNVRMYEHFGFKVVERDPIPGTDFVSWAMLREARSTASIKA